MAAFETVDEQQLVAVTKAAKDEAMQHNSIIGFAPTNKAHLNQAVQAVELAVRKIRYCKWAERWEDSDCIWRVINM